jgi:hypothetical protein
MWYHYVILVLALYSIATTLYTQVTGRLTWFDRLSGVASLAVSLAAASWCYSGINTPPSMFGARRY